MELNQISLFFISLIIGVILGSAVFWLVSKIRLGGFRNIAADIVKTAEQDAENIKKSTQLSIKQSHVEQQKELDEIYHNERRKLLREEERLKQREDKLEGRMNLVEKAIRY